jgi:glycosyltransferase involved in cell wall biosynthesis
MSPAPAPTVSVITPVWNAEATLAETVASVRAQSFPDWEIILVDDGSTDGSRELARQLAAEEPRIRWWALGQNRGTAEARNAAIRAARGRYLAFLDADDLWQPEKLEVQLGHMARTGAPFVFSAYRRIAVDGRLLGRVAVPARLTHAELLKGNVIGCLTAIYDTAHFGKVEMPSLRRRQDFGLWLKLLRRGGEAHGLPQELAAYRVRRGSRSSRSHSAVPGTWMLDPEVAGLSRMQSGYYPPHNLARGIGKRLAG